MQTVSTAANVWVDHICLCSGPLLHPHTIRASESRCVAYDLAATAAQLAVFFVAGLSRVDSVCFWLLIAHIAAAQARGS